MRKSSRLGEFKEAITLALDVLLRNPLRSFLTVLGIVIGVTTIIVIGAVINGLNANVLGNIQSLGSSTIIVSKISWATFGRPSMELLQRKDIKPEMGLTAWRRYRTSWPLLHCRADCKLRGRCGIERGAARESSGEECHPGRRRAFRRADQQFQYDQWPVFQ